MLCSVQFDRALMLAAIVHRNQVRKGTAVPYLIHPVHVAAILERAGVGEPVPTAALLHDALEDLRPEEEEVREALRSTFVPLGDAPDAPGPFRERLERFIAEEFGEPVLALVRAVTEQKRRPDGVEIPTAQRRAAKLEYFRRADTPRDVIALKGADALHNARSIVMDLAVHGLAMMRRFNGTPEETLRYYAAIARIVEERLGGHPLSTELTAAVNELAATLEIALGDAESRVHAVITELRLDGARDEPPPA